MEYQDYTIGIYSVNLIDDIYILEPTLNLKNNIYKNKFSFFI